ncbi:hypothetical protein F2P56_023836 [Juglans regia]|uniref:RNase H type-1 domain-containing protein n=1 Tax=Juglans regia TaxID=51240 RepID=A0A833UAW5_JUGRE|nr:hypothetical protein F2P56_023836 [Juglans regia]
MQLGTIATRAQADLSLFKERNQININRAERCHGRGSTQTWKLLDCPYFIVNFDATFDKDNGRMGLGIIIRDSEGSLQACLTAFKDHICLVFQAESVALHKAMELCIELGLSQVSFEGDAKVVIDAVNSKKEANSWLGRVTKDLSSWWIATQHGD